MHGGTLVEVRKNPKSTTWYQATLLDVVGENILVGFEDDIWPQREVPAYSVRRTPRDGDLPDDFQPQEDEVVEVLVRASATNPVGWALGRVKTIKNSFFFIGFVGTQRGLQDLIVERSALRRVNAEPAISPEALTRRLIPIDPTLHNWAKQAEDARGCLSHVQSRVGLDVCRFINCPSAEEEQEEEQAAEAEAEPEVLLIGEESAVSLGAKLLLQIHFKNQVEMMRFHDVREVLIQRLEERQRYLDNRHVETFTVDQAYIGRVIGKKGENINRIRDKYSVEIKTQVYQAVSVPVAEQDQAERPATIFTVMGDKDKVLKAREELEYITVYLPLQVDEVGWILGKGFQNISDIAKKTELYYARFDHNSQALELCGLRPQVEDAKLLISAHGKYLAVYREIDQEHVMTKKFEVAGGAEDSGYREAETAPARTRGGSRSAAGSRRGGGR
mmetsp:Transcript_46652/g.120794  ORF Transcript_46652/g.120794 Transcript_46652/m.120794 type:complete len:445 (+) Transcript_46652:3-1337(+)